MAKTPSVRVSIRLLLNPAAGAICVSIANHRFGQICYDTRLMNHVSLTLIYS